MKNILISHGWDEKYPVEILEKSGAKLHYTKDQYLPFDFWRDTESNQFLLHKNKIIKKDGVAGIPFLVSVKGASGEVEDAYNMHRDNCLAVNEIDLFIPNLSVINLQKQKPFHQLLQSYNVPVSEDMASLYDSMDKIKTYEKIALAGLPVPDYICFDGQDVTTQEVEAFWKKHKGEIILKKAVSNFGKGVFIPTDMQDMLRLIEELKHDAHGFIIQKKIKINPPLHHIRIAVSFGEIIAVQKFYADDTKPTSHVGSHTSVEQITLSDSHHDLCRNLAQVVNVNLCSFDCLIDLEGNLFFLEANATPQINKWYPDQAKKMTEDIVSNFLS